MNNPLKPHEAVVRCQIRSVEFGFYTDKDVRDRSVLEVTTRECFGPTGNPLPGGLYDLVLGPQSDRDPHCPTCAMPYNFCPGHFGHIELVVPVHHPLLVNELLTILRSKCLHCHRLKLGPRPLAIYRGKFHQLYSHNTNGIAEMERRMNTAVVAARNDGEGAGRGGARVTAASAARVLDQVLREFQPDPSDYIEDGTNDNNRGNQQQKKKKHPPRRYKLDSYERELRNTMVKDLMSQCTRELRCEHCGAYSPKIRQDSSNKFFRSHLATKSQRSNNLEGITIDSAMKESRDQGGYDSDDSARAKAAARRRGVAAAEPEDEDGLGKTKDDYMHTREVQAQLRRTWERDPFLMNCLYGKGGSFDKDGYQHFFIQAIPVPPSRFRPVLAVGHLMAEHSQTQYLGKTILYNERIRNHFAQGNESSAYREWIMLQTCVNCYMDSSKDPSPTPINLVSPGIRQVLERKEGLFRKNMMGKRVDYACRSVISPDPYIGTNEIGLPRYFATVLTVPVPVTDYNVREMRALIERGPSNYPGARWVETNGLRLNLWKMNPQRRTAIAATLLKSLKKSGNPTIVGRQMCDGDYVLMNRQPTLHKPGIMAHRVRILHNPTQKTIRMHYANCNTYNADFDGDEMNGHLPQSLVAQAEARYIANTDAQYIVPTDGSPLRGLIQDHVVAGVKLTKRDTFLEKWEFQQLVHASLSSLPGIEVIRADQPIELPPPSIMKPRELWTGKQVVSTILHHIQKGSDRDDKRFSNFPGISMSRKSKTPDSAFGAKHEEHLVIIRDGELLRGVLDKAAFGHTDSSLVHCVYEAYGAEKAGVLLNAFSRVFTAYIQYYAGHSCRTEDLILTKEADDQRKELVQLSYNMGTRAAKAWADSEGGKIPIPPVEEIPNASKPLKPVELATTRAKIGELLSGSEGTDNFKALDGFMQGQLNPLSSKIVKKALPGGLVVPFPTNSFGIMTTTGAKGSIVNQSQVICSLGQQALEGRRVPRMSSGRTLPSFLPFDPNPRADGFVMDRFLTGIRPQEYYFHCMAGREGLVDTAVKTSRSGYLQRCLIKHLEDLKVCYDHTVRNSEGSVIQFLYGEDGIDPTKACFLDCSEKSLEFMARNHDSMRRHNFELPSSSIDIAAADAHRDKDIREKTDGLLHQGARVLARKIREGDEWKRGALCVGWFEAIISRVSKSGTAVDLEYLDDGSKATRVPIEVELGRCGSKRIPAASNVATLVKPASFDPIISGRGNQRIGSHGCCMAESVASRFSKVMRTSDKLKSVLEIRNLSAEKLGSLVAAKYSTSLCAPGEAVGSIAAQSIGEPSTQMTLNTFHLAGSGANVTLGIPRLREIIMTASKENKTPTMSVPLRSFVSNEDAIKLTRRFKKLTLMEVLSGDRGVTVTERLEMSSAGNWSRSYHIRLRLHPAERIKTAFGLSIHDIARAVCDDFVQVLSTMMKRELRRSKVEGDMASTTVEKALGQVVSIEGGEQDGEEGNRPTPEAMQDDLGDDDDDDYNDDMPGEDDGVAGNRPRSQSVSYEDDDSENDEAGGGRRNDMEEDDDDDYGDGEKKRVEEEDYLGPDPLSEEVLGKDDAVVVDEKQNSITLQPLRIDPSGLPLLMVGLVEAAAAKTIVRAQKKIDQAFINDEENGRGKCLQTAGANFSSIWDLEEVDHDRLMCNDVWGVRSAYGVEAGRMNIVEQIRSVFGVYGIEVDPRHLCLIADYMTFEGGFKPMNRIGMRESASAFLQMSFETTTDFLRVAALGGDRDEMRSPSANIVAGRLMEHGTGLFDVLAA